MNKIKQWLVNFWYSLPFGLKGADSEIFGAKTSNGDNVTIQQEISDQRVAKHLLKGEVTQEVEELRYRTYKVANESEGFEYLGNGVAVKKEEKLKDSNLERIKFSQENENICETVLETLKQVGSYGIEKYRFEINYSFASRFKIEKFATKVDVDIDEKIGKIETTLHFNSEPNPYDAASMPFINELKKLGDAKNEYEINRNEIASSIRDFSFSTYKAKNEDNFVTYSFMNGSKFKSFEKKNYEYLMTLTWDEYVRLPLDLEAKYYSKSMSDKYKNNDKKNVAIPLAETERKEYCSICGKEINTYDSDIQKANFKNHICNHCMMESLKNK